MPSDKDGGDATPIRRHDMRYCRTHSMVAELFAKSSFSQPTAEAWNFNADAWARLAELRERERARSPVRHIKP